MILSKEARETLEEILQEVDDDLITSIRNSKWEDRKMLLNQLDTLNQLKERIYARATN